MGSEVDNLNAKLSSVELTFVDVSESNFQNYCLCVSFSIFYCLILIGSGQSGEIHIHI